MNGWNSIKRLIAELSKRERRARSMAARDREMPKMRAVLDQGNNKA